MSEIEQTEKQRLRALYEFETEYYNRGITLIAGCDEAGRGPLAGPVVAAAVILPPYCEIPGLNDSKKLTERKRFLLEPEIKAKAVAWAVARIEQDEIDERVKEAIELVGLDYEAVKDKSPFELSGGQKRRVAIAGVVAMRPKVLILDEPTAGLDPKAHQDILEMIQKVHETFGNIIIFVSHNMADIARLSDQVLVISDGKKVMDGSPEEVFAHRNQLAKMGLSVPPVTELVERLKEKGLDVKGNILDLDKAEEAIAKALGK